MKTILTIIPEMYADWTAIGWSMLLGKPPKGLAMEPKPNVAQAIAKRAGADTGISVKPAQKARGKPAAKKATAKRAARKSTPKKHRVTGKRR